MLKYNYEDVRRLETLVLNHPTMVKIKVTMIEIISSGKFVSDYYDLNDMGIRNMYLQVINTYFDKTKSEYLLTKIDNGY